MTPDTVDRLNKLCDAFGRAASVIRQETDEVVASADHIALIRHFKSLRDANETIKTAKAALTDLEDALSVTHIPDLLRNLKDTIGLKTPINLEGVGRITVSYRYSCSMEDKPKGIQWLKDNGHGGIVQETVNSSTLSAFARDMTEQQGKDLPSDIFKTGTKPYTSITKG